MRRRIYELLMRLAFYRAYRRWTDGLPAWAQVAGERFKRRCERFGERVECDYLPAIRAWSRRVRFRRALVGAKSAPLSHLTPVVVPYFEFEFEGRIVRITPRGREMVLKNRRIDPSLFIAE